jgi:hypothetical protein
MPRTLKRILAVAFLLLLCARVANVWWVRRAILRAAGDAYDWKAWELVGSGAVNCGRVEVGTGSRAANECTMKAFLTGRPFRVRYDLQGYDSDISAGLVRAGDGRMYAISFDGDPWGKGGTSLFRQQVTTTECPQPAILRMSVGNRMTCFSAMPASPMDIMAPNSEPY